MRTSQLILIGTFIVFGIGIALSSSLFPPPGPTLSSTTDTWKQYIEKVGGVKAYNKLATLITNESLATQHEKAHLFGEALYAAENIDGLSACDTQFSYGCFHEFLARAIAEHGEIAIADINKRCAEKVGNDLSCQHGLGHGILASGGYSFDDLRTALSVCDKLTTPTPGGCFGGAFMEYNMRIMLAGDEGIRPASENWNEPCSSLPSRYARACYYTLPQWWHATLDMPLLERYSTIGARCATLSGDVRRSCYAGIGFEILAVMEQKTDTAIALCNAAAHEDDLVWCLSIVSQAFPRSDDRQKAICAPLSGQDHARCISYGNDQDLVLALQGFSIGETR